MQGPKAKDMAGLKMARFGGGSKSRAPLRVGRAEKEGSGNAHQVKGCFWFDVSFVIDYL